MSGNVKPMIEIFVLMAWWREDPCLAKLLLNFRKQCLIARPKNKKAKTYSYTDRK